MLDLVISKVRELICQFGRPSLRLPLGPHTHLIDDLGLDSFKFLDLTIMLEHALDLDEFPMQAWVDEQRAASSPLTLQALADECTRLKRSCEGSADE